MRFSNKGFWWENNFRKEIIMPSPKKDDILAVLHAGAYCRSMASNYNLREIPEEIIL